MFRCLDCLSGHLVRHNLWATAEALRVGWTPFLESKLLYESFFNKPAAIGCNPVTLARSVNHPAPAFGDKDDVLAFALQPITEPAIHTGDIKPCGHSFVSARRFKDVVDVPFSKCFSPTLWKRLEYIQGYREHPPSLKLADRQVGTNGICNDKFIDYLSNCRYKTVVYH